MKDSETTIEDLRSLVAQFVRERDWEQFHDPKNLAMSIAIEAAELMEHFQWDKNDQIPGLFLPALVVMCDERDRQTALRSR